MTEENNLGPNNTRNSLVVSEKLELTEYRCVLITRGLVLANELLNDYPERQMDALTFFIKGIIYESEGKYEQALVNYKKVAEMCPNWVAPHYKIGHVFKEKNNYAQATSYYTSVIGMEPDNFFAHFERGLCFYELKQYKQSIRDFQRALEIAQVIKNDTIYNWIIKLDYPVVTKLFYAITQKEEKMLRLRYGIAETSVYDENGVFSHVQFGSKERFDKNKYLTLLYRSLSLTYSSDSQYEKAIEYTNKIIVNNPNDLSAHRVRGVCHLNIGFYHRALSDISKVIELDPNDTKAHKFLEYISKKIKKHEEKIKKLIILGEEQGFVTYDDINDALPFKITGSKLKDRIVVLLGKKNINVIDNDEDERTVSVKNNDAQKDN